MRIWVKVLLHNKVLEQLSPKIMSIQEFSQLPLDEMTNYLWDNGVCISQRLASKKAVVCIFQIDAFFVEAVYSSKDNRVERIQPIIELREWDAYVDCLIRSVIYQS
jgi:hypothetical protein